MINCEKHSENKKRTVIKFMFENCCCHCQFKYENKSFDC